MYSDSTINLHSFHHIYVQSQSKKLLLENKQKKAGHFNVLTFFSIFISITITIYVKVFLKRLSIKASCIPSFIKQIFTHSLSLSLTLFFFNILTVLLNLSPFSPIKHFFLLFFSGKN